MQHTLAGNVSLGYNLRAEWNGMTAQPTYIYTLTKVVSFTKKVKGYLEVYKFIPQHSEASHLMHGGLTYLLHKNLMLDLSGGFGLTTNAPENFLSVGISFRFKTRE